MLKPSYIKGFSILQITKNSIKERMVTAIKNGLSEAKEVKRRKVGLIDNALSIDKSDKVANSLISEFQDDSAFRHVLCQRGWYTILFLYNLETKTIYSFFREERFRELINRKTINKPHYIDTLLDFNDDFGRKQLVIDEELFTRNEANESKIQELRAKIVAMLDNNEPERYITICYSIDYFRLCTVRAVLTSKYLEIIEENDWSDYINIDYSDVEFDETANANSEEDIKVTPKANISKQDENDDLNIPVKKATQKKS